MTSATFSAPASSGNLGPGFDTLGMALDLRNELRVEPGNGRIIVEGEGARELPVDSTNLVARAFDSVAPGARLQLDLHCVNRIPLARGLGSSAAAAALGLMAGYTAADIDWDTERLFDDLVAFDGHADNAAACVYGGITIVHDRRARHGADAEPDVVPLGPADWIELVALIPDRALATADARTVLPAAYTPNQVVSQLGALALVMTGLAGGHPELLADGLNEDVLHEPQRTVLVPELAEMRDTLADTAALGVTLSGAGSTVLAWCAAGDGDQVEAALHIEWPERRVERFTVADEGVAWETTAMASSHE